MCHVRLSVRPFLVEISASWKKLCDPKQCKSVVFDCSVIQNSVNQLFLSPKKCVTLKSVRLSVRSNQLFLTVRWPKTVQISCFCLLRDPKNCVTVKSVCRPSAQISCFLTVQWLKTVQTNCFRLLSDPKKYVTLKRVGPSVRPSLKSVVFDWSVTQNSANQLFLSVEWPKTVQISCLR